MEFQAFFISFGSVSSAYSTFSLGIANNAYFMFDVATSCTSATFSGDFNTWVHLVYIYNLGAALAYFKSTNANSAYVVWRNSEILFGNIGSALEI